MSHIVQQGASLKGIYRFTVSDCSSREARTKQFIINSIQKITSKTPRGRFRRWLEAKNLRFIQLFNKKFIVRQFVLHNITTTVGREALAKALSANLASLAEIEVNETALGTGTTAVAVGDTTLDTETFRKAIASRTFTGNVAYLTAFYTALEVTGTFFEHGLFINGTGAADSGVLLSRVLLNPPAGITKSSTETLTIDYTITLSDA